MLLENIAFPALFFAVIIVFILCFIKKPKVDKQLAVLDAYIDSVAKCNDLKIPNESLVIDRKKIFKKITKKLMREIQEIEKVVHNIACKDFVFGVYVEFKGSVIYGPTDKWDGLYNYVEWYLSLEKTISLARQWPEVKLEVLRLYRERKQREISEYNKSVDELSTLV